MKNFKSILKMKRKIVSPISNQFWCERCKRATNIIYLNVDKIYCESCVGSDKGTYEVYDDNGNKIEV